MTLWTIFFIKMREGACAKGIRERIRKEIEREREREILPVELQRFLALVC
jgi:hypothetical protein